MVTEEGFDVYCPAQRMLYTRSTGIGNLGISPLTLNTTDAIIHSIPAN